METLITSKVLVEILNILQCLQVQYVCNIEMSTLFQVQYSLYAAANTPLVTPESISQKGVTRDKPSSLRGRKTMPPIIAQGSDTPAKEGTLKSRKTVTSGTKCMCCTCVKIASFPDYMRKEDTFSSLTWPGNRAGVKYNVVGGLVQCTGKAKRGYSKCGAIPSVGLFRNQV